MVFLKIALLASLLSISAWGGANAQTLTGATPVTTAAGAALGIVAKAAPGTSLDAYVVNLTNVAGFFVGYNATAIPADGALTPALVLDCQPVAAANSTTQASTASITNIPGPGTNYSVGIVYFLTSASTCYTKTTGTITGFISAKVQ